MTLLRKLYLLPLILLFSIVNCDLNPTSSKVSVGNEESDYLAYSTAGTLEALDLLSAQIKNDLMKLRNEYSDSIPAVKQIYRPNAKPSNILIKVDSITADSILNFDKYPSSWVSLNTKMRLDSTNHIFSEWFSMHFKGKLNPNALVDIYAEMPGLLITHTNGYNASPKILLKQTDTLNHYFFCRSHSYDYSGPFYYDFYYFTISIRDEIIYHGSYLNWEWGVEVEDTWWFDIAKEEFEIQRTHNVWRRDSVILGFYTAKRRHIFASPFSTLILQDPFTSHQRGS